MAEKGELMKLIGDNVRHYRMERKMTQEELANLIGKNSSAITRIEGGSRMMSVPTLLAVSNALGVSSDALLRDRSACDGQETINYLLSSQTKDSLSKLEKVIQALIQVYGEEGRNSTGENSAPV